MTTDLPDLPDLPEIPDLPELIDDQETDHIPPARTHRRTATHRRLLRITARDHLARVLGPPLRLGETLHVQSDATWDAWDLVPTILDHWTGPAHCHAATWTISRRNADEIIALLDAATLRSITLITRTYFARRDASTYAHLRAALAKRNQRIRLARSHAKVTLLRTHETALSIETSANLNSNPRIEQYTITHDPALYDFHRTWIDDLATAQATVSPTGRFYHRRAGPNVASCTTAMRARHFRAYRCGLPLTQHETPRYAAQMLYLLRDLAPDLDPTATHLYYLPDRPDDDRPNASPYLDRHIATTLHLPEPIPADQARLSPHARHIILIADDVADGQHIRTTMQRLAQLAQTQAPLAVTLCVAYAG